MTMTVESVETSILERLSHRQIPILPSGVPNLLKSLTDENIDFFELARIIERFPTIAGRLMALANSAWSSPVSTVTSLEMACSRLGFGVVRSASIALAVASPFNPSRCPRFNAETFWSNALMTADAASWLAPVATSVNGLESSTARTAGLLHNLGLLWLADQLPDEVDQAFLMLKENSSSSLKQALSELIGFDDAQAGGHLGSTWNLPEPLVMAMAHYNEPNFQGTYWETASLVGVATTLVSAIQQDASCPISDVRLKNLGITTSSVEKVFIQLTQQLEKIRELANNLFNY